jgi:hypothetical protein
MTAHTVADWKGVLWYGVSGMGGVDGGASCAAGGLVALGGTGLSSSYVCIPHTGGLVALGGTGLSSSISLSHVLLPASLRWLARVSLALVWALVWALV